MNIRDLHIAFKVELDKNAINIGASGSPSFLPEEIDYWLYSAYLSKIATKFTGNNPTGVPFEAGIKRVADLQGLVKTDKGLTLLSEANSNKLLFDNFKSSIVYGSQVQDKRMYFIQGTLYFGGGKSVPVSLISHEQSKKFAEAYNNRPWIPEPVATLENNRLTIFIDRDLFVAPFSLDLTYLAYPKRLNNDDITSGMDEIPEYMQYEVVKLAADMAIENIESPRSQTHHTFTQISE